MRFEVFKFLTDSALGAEAQSFAFRFSSSSNGAGKFFKNFRNRQPEKIICQKIIT